MDRPIGLFDSGFGGLTVMREVSRLLPKENLIYLGDTAHLPYGNKSPEAVLQFALENAAFLLQKKIKLLIIACHTACSHALEALQRSLPIPVIGVIEPGLKLIQGISRLALLATSSTIESQTYQALIQAQNPQIQLYPKACPLFVPLIEEGFYNHPAATLIAESYLTPLKNKIDAALLACTHYPLLRPLLQQVLGPDVRLIEPAAGCALEAKNYLSRHQLLNFQNNQPYYEFYATDAPEKFGYFGTTFFGSPIGKVHPVKESVEKKKFLWKDNDPGSLIRS
jgi:glutamate racemase